MPSKKPRKDNELKNETTYQNALEKGKKIFNLYSKAKTFVSNRQDALTELMAFYQGSQYDLASYDNNKPWVVQMNTPHASLAIDIRVSSLVATDYIGILEPYSPDDKEKVEALQGVLEDTWYDLTMDEKITDCIHTGAIVREGYIHIMYDKDKITGGKNRLMKGKIEAYSLDTSHVFLDPEARTFENCNYICITERANKEKVFKQYPFLKDRINRSTLSPAERGELYLLNDYDTEQSEVLTKIVVYVKDYDESGKSFKIKQYILIEECLVEEHTLDGLKRFPIAQFRWKRSADSAYGLSLMDDLLCLQKAINAIESATTNTAIAYASPSFVMTRSCGISPKALARASGAPGAVFVVDGDPANAIIPLVPPKLDDRIVNIKSEFEQTMQSIAGISGSYIGSLGTAGNTTGSAELAIDRAKIIETLVTANIEVFVKQITFILTDYILSVYVEGKEIYTRKRDASTGKINFQTRIIPEGTKDVDFSFYVDLSTRTKFSQEQEARTLKELYQQERQYDAPIKLINELDILNASNTRNKEYLRERYKRELMMSAEQKVGLINQITQVGQKYGIDPSMITASQVEIINNDQKMEVTKQVLQMAEQASAQMEAQAQESNQAMIDAGFDPQLVEEASQAVLSNGLNADMFR